MFRVNQLIGFGIGSGAVTIGRVLANSGSYALVGNAAGVQKVSPANKILTAAASAYSLTGATAIFAKPDVFFSNVKLLMGFNDTDGSTGSPGMADESGAAHGTATVTGAAQIDTAQSVFGGSSYLGDGSTSYISFADHADWNLANQNFTLEFRVRTTTVSGTHFVCGQWSSGGNLGWTVYFDNATLQLVVTENGTSGFIPVTTTLAANTWYAIAIDFNGSKYRMYKDGVMSTSSTASYTIFNSSNPLLIGANNNAGSRFYFSGWIDELRLTVGTARYASDGGYTVATSAFPRS